MLRRQIDEDSVRCGTSIHNPAPPATSFANNRARSERKIVDGNVRSGSGIGHAASHDTPSSSSTTCATSATGVSGVSGVAVTSNTPAFDTSSDASSFAIGGGGGGSGGTSVTRNGSSGGVGSSRTAGSAARGVRGKPGAVQSDMRTWFPANSETPAHDFDEGEANSSSSSNFLTTKMAGDVVHRIHLLEEDMRNLKSALIQQLAASTVSSAKQQLRSAEEDATTALDVTEKAFDVTVTATSAAAAAAHSNTDSRAEEASTAFAERASPVSPKIDLETVLKRFDEINMRFDSVGMRLALVEEQNRSASKAHKAICSDLSSIAQTSGSQFSERLEALERSHRISNSADSEAVEKMKKEFDDLKRETVSKLSNFIVQTPSVEATCLEEQRGYKILDRVRLYHPMTKRQRDVVMWVCSRNSRGGVEVEHFTVERNGTPLVSFVDDFEGTDDRLKTSRDPVVEGRCGEISDVEGPQRCCSEA